MNDFLFWFAVALCIGILAYQWATREFDDDD